MGLCPECYGDQKRSEEREEERDRERRRERERQEERNRDREREERYRDREREREERRHRERIEEYERQAAEDAAEAKRLAGLKTFTCNRCKATFNEEQGISAVKSPIHEPLCYDCLSLYAVCSFCSEVYMGSIKTLSYEYYKGASCIEKRASSKMICRRCESSNSKAINFLKEQDELSVLYEKQERIKAEEEARKAQAERLALAEQKLNREIELIDEERREKRNNVIISVVVGVVFAAALMFISQDIIASIILGIGSLLHYFFTPNLKAFLCLFVGGALVCAIGAFLWALLVSTYSWVPFSSAFIYAFVIATPLVMILFKKMAN